MNEVGKPRGLRVFIRCVLEFIRATRRKKRDLTPDTEYQLQQVSLDWSTGAVTKPVSLLITVPLLLSSHASSARCVRARVGPPQVHFLHVVEGAYQYVMK